MFEKWSHWFWVGCPIVKSCFNNCLTNSDPDVLVTALCALARQPLAQVEPLLAWTNHPDTEVRLRAIEALSMVENSEAKVWLAKHVKDDDERIWAVVLSRSPELLTSDEPSMWVRCMAMANGADIDGRWCPHQNGDWGHFGQGVVAAEDDFLHSLFSWNLLKKSLRDTVCFDPEVLLVTVSQIAVEGLNIFPH